MAYLGLGLKNILYTTEAPIIISWTRKFNRASPRASEWATTGRAPDDTHCIFHFDFYSDDSVWTALRNFQRFDVLDNIIIVANIIVDCLASTL